MFITDSSCFCDVQSWFANARLCSLVPDLDARIQNDVGGSAAPTKPKERRNRLCIGPCKERWILFPVKCELDVLLG